MAVSGTGTTRANFGDLLEPGFRQIFFQQYAELPTVYDQIFHVLTSERMQEYDSSVSGFGQLVEKSEGAAITYEDPLQGYDKTYVHLTYGKGFKVTREMYEDDLYSIMNRMPKALASAVTRTVEEKCATIFDNSFTSGTGGDAKHLCATDHPRSDGGTAQNNETTGALTEAKIEAILVAMRGTLDDKGQRILVRPDTLLVPPALEMEANILMKSTGRTATNYNEINPYQGRLNILVWDYLDNSTTAYWIIDSGLHQLNFFWRRKPDFAQDESFDTDAALYKTTCRLSVGWSDWRGVYGSTGT